MKKSILIVLTSLFLLVGCQQEDFSAEINIVPEPVEWTQQEGYFTLNKKTKIVLQNIDSESPTMQYILDFFAKNMGMKLKIADSKDIETNVIVLTINNPQVGILEDEGYHLVVNPDKIAVQVNTEAGLVYAIQTLYQLAPPAVNKTKPRKIKLPAVTIVDFPRFEWRGSHLDVCRHFFDIDYIKKHLDVLALFKMNKFHWHLTDDHGWRLQIDKYPKLTEIGAWRVDRSDVPWTEGEPPREGEEATYGGFFTKEQVREVIAYAAARNIEVIPEIEIPGHSSAILASYPEYACDDYPYHVAIGPYWPPKAILCGGNDDVMVFLKDVLDEVAELFPSKYIHIGGDEAIKKNWEECPKCQKRIKALGLKNEEALQGWMIREIEKHLAEKGKTIIGWDEIIEGGVTPDAVVMFWRGWLGDKGVQASLKDGNEVIMAPNSHCYFDYYQADKETEPQAICCYIPLEAVYKFDPIPSVLTSDQAKYIKGAQCNLWAEFLFTSDHVEYMLLPRLLALSESVWSPKDVKNWDRFLEKLPAQKERLKALGYNYCDKVGLIKTEE